MQIESLRNRNTFNPPATGIPQSNAYQSFAVVLPSTRHINSNTPTLEQYHSWNNNRFK